MKTFYAATRQRWRTWLASHHDSESEIWLIFHKKHTGKPAIAYKDALDEALCYGWIDSLVKRIDDKPVRPEVHPAPNRQQLVEHQHQAL
jgi:uncharacterized protein YdeI (YjbR/CyaY-like superfamily)